MELISTYADIINKNHYAIFCGQHVIKFSRLADLIFIYMIT